MTRLPPIFAKHRFDLPEKMRPAVVFHVSAEMDMEAEELASQLDRKSVPATHFGCWWVESGAIAILSTILGETAYGLHVFGRKSGQQRPFVFDVRALNDPSWNDLADWQKVAAACYVRGAILFASYTEREAEMSVNTLTRNRARVLVRQGDTIRYAPATSLASAAGQARQRDYTPPEDPSGIRMRLHDVRGHWRTYASGVRVWVRPHQRGDEALGRVTRVLH